MGTVGGIREPHSEHGAALRKNGWVDLRRSLADNHRTHTILPTFLNDPAGRDGSSTPVPGVQIGMRFLQDKQQRPSSSALREVTRPEQRVEQEADEHADKVHEDRYRHTGEVENGYRCLLYTSPSPRDGL